MIEAMKLALDALEDWKTYMYGHWDVIDEQAITSLRQAIAEAEKQEPVAVISAKELSSMSQDLKGVDTSQSGYHWRVGWNAALRQAMDYSMPPLCTHPKPKREPLTGEMLITAAQSCLSPHQYDHFEALLESDPDAHNRLARAIETKLKEKNA